MVTMFLLLIIGIALHIFAYKKAHADELTLKRQAFWKEFDESFPQEISDKVNTPISLTTFYHVTETESYESLTKEERGNLLWYLYRLKDLDEEFQRDLKQIDYLTWAANISLFIALILFTNSQI
tara:strand:- start:160 stop:531 length:372 start_codon:yes stop_codon:yes gene_type:complete